MNRLVLIRGVPGSGKTTLAKRYAEQGFVHCEADQYFEGPNGYVFRREELPQAHKACFEAAKLALENGFSCVVANTFIRRWEMQPYLVLAELTKINAEIFTVDGHYQNIHGVSEEIVQRMRDRFEW